MDETDELARFRQLRRARDPALRAVIREALILEHLPLARNMAEHYHAPGWSREDLEHEGVIGLMKAIDKYDPDGLHKGRSFPTVATFAIRKAIWQAVAGDIAEQPTVVLHHLTPLNPPSWLLSAERITRELPQLAAPGPSVEEQVTQTVDGAQVSATLEAALLLLSERQRYIIRHRYGLDAECGVGGVGGVAWTQRETASALGISQQAVSKQERNALSKLRRELTTHADGVLALRQLHERQRRQRRVSNAA